MNPVKSQPKSKSRCCRKRGSSESDPTGDELIADPLPTDILCGKDKTYHKHAGNVIFRKLIEEHTAEYIACGNSKNLKMAMTKKIVLDLQVRCQARFLKPCGNNWCEISNLLARDKVSHALRFAASRRGLGTSLDVAESKSSDDSRSNSPVQPAASVPPKESSSTMIIDSSEQEEDDDLSPLPYTSLAAVVSQDPPPAQATVTTVPLADRTGSMGLMDEEPIQVDQELTDPTPFLNDVMLDKDPICRHRSRSSSLRRSTRNRYHHFHQVSEASSKNIGVSEVSSGEGASRPLFSSSSSSHDYLEQRSITASPSPCSSAPTSPKKLNSTEDDYEAMIRQRFENLQKQLDLLVSAGSTAVQPLKQQPILSSVISCPGRSNSDSTNEYCGSHHGTDQCERIEQHLYFESNRNHSATGIPTKLNNLQLPLKSCQSQMPLARKNYRTTSIDLLCAMAAEEGELICSFSSPPAPRPFEMRRQSSISISAIEQVLLESFLEDDDDAQRHYSSVDVDVDNSLIPV